MFDINFIASRGESGRSPDDESRTLRDRQASRDAARDNASSRRPSESASRRLVQVFQESSLPTAAGKYFATHPAEAGGTEAEGSAASLIADTTTTLYVIFLGTAPLAGDYAVATNVGGRWVAQRSGKPKLNCRWICGPWVAFDTPTGGGTNCHAALASLSVADDGTISGVQLLDAGACYNVAHPAAKVRTSEPGFAATQPGTGATLLATVGEVTTLTLNAAGSGYDPSNPPSITIAAPGGSGSTATATATVNPDGTLDSNLAITSGGSLYQVANPTVTIGPPGAGGTQATATATAQPGVVTSLKVVNPGSGYLDPTPPDSLNVTVAGDNWSASLTLTSGYNLTFTGPAGSPGGNADGTLPYCAWSGTTTVDLISGSVDGAGNGCPDITGATLYAAVFHSVNTGGWVLQVDLNVGPALDVVPGGNPCLSVSSAYTDQATQGGPFRAISLPGCAGRPFSQVIPSGSAMRGSEPSSAITWWALEGGFYGPGDDTPFGNPNKPLAYTFTITEPSP